MTPDDLIRALQENTLEMRALKIEIVALRSLLSGMSNQPIAIAPTSPAGLGASPTPGAVVDGIVDLFDTLGVRWEPKKQPPPRGR